MCFTLQYQVSYAYHDSLYGIYFKSIFISVALDSLNDYKYVTIW